MDDSAFASIPGGQALIDWFGRVPHFHDGNLFEINLSSGEPSTIRIHTFGISEQLDESGRYVLDRHATVTFTLEVIGYVELSDFGLPGIIFDLEVTKVDDGYQLAWSGSYGVAGTIRAQRLRADLQPGKP
jgi:hypothetical protein